MMTRSADGAFVVTPLTLSAVEKALRARYAIELGAAELTVGQVAEERLLELRRMLGNTGPKLFDEGGWDAYLPAYLEFHEQVVALAGSAALVDAYRRANAPAMIISAISGRLAETGDDREACITAYGHHKDLIAAYEAADLEAVKRAILTHIDYSLDTTRRFMDAAGGRV
jgi:DNA-binding GntR family transcriptional regulator